MLVNNYRIWAAFLYTFIYRENVSQFLSIGLKDISGSTVNQMPVNMNEDGAYKNMFVAGCKDRALRTELNGRVGTGTTDESTSDYCLDNDITSQLSDVVSTSSCAADGDRIRTFITVSGRSTSSSQISITEIGITKTTYFYNGSWTNPSQTDVLLLRKILDTPVVIQPNGTFSITIEWDEE